MSTDPIFVDPDQTHTPAGSTSYTVKTEATTDGELMAAMDAVHGVLAFFAPHLHVGVGGSTADMTIGITCDTPPHLASGHVQARLALIVERDRAIFDRLGGAAGTVSEPAAEVYRLRTALQQIRDESPDECEHDPEWASRRAAFALNPQGARDA